MIIRISHTRTHNDVIEVRAREEEEEEDEEEEEEEEEEKKRKNYDNERSSLLHFNASKEQNKPARTLIHLETPQPDSYLWA